MLYVASMTEVLESQFLFVTEQSMMKLVDGTEFDVATRKTIDATKLNSGDRLLFVGRCDSMEYVVLQSREGFFLRFLQQEVPVKKKNAIGVRGMRLGEGDALEQAYLLEGPYGVHDPLWREKDFPEPAETGKTRHKRVEKPGINFLLRFPFIGDTII